MTALLEDKVCVVTGANRGIGRAVARLFVAEGACVYACARRDGSLDALVGDCGPERLVPLYFDVTDTKGMKAAFLQVRKEQGRLDALVNNAGIMKDALIGMIAPELVSEVFEVNVSATIAALQFAAGLMRRQGSGSIINFSSIVGVEGVAGQAVYAASKGAVVALTKAAAKELAPQGVRVNAVAPGFIDTDLFRSIGEKRVEGASGNVGMGRLGTPDDVARACAFLASDLSDYVTGQILGIDGSARV
ncbi:MAG: SDR family oxidoreductase [Coriobacteriales bacterium]|jgi:3-oxoacyl-[acyl-carrier protein] reductase|nr:SDR family oxidoreductase [Coriobacteriales bacterium]